MFKKLTFIIIALLVFAGTSYSAELRWDEYSDQSSIVGFIIHSQEVTEAMDGTIYSEKIDDPTATSYSLDPTLYEPGHTYRFWVSAYNDLAESEKAQADKDWTPAVFSPNIVERPIVLTVPGPVSTITIIQQ